MRKGAEGRAVDQVCDDKPGLPAEGVARRRGQDFKRWHHHAVAVALAGVLALGEVDEGVGEVEEASGVRLQALRATTPSSTRATQRQVA